MRSFDSLKEEWLKDEKFAKVYYSKSPLRVFIRMMKSASLRRASRRRIWPKR